MGIDLTQVIGEMRVGESDNRRGPLRAADRLGYSAVTSGARLGRTRRLDPDRRPYVWRNSSVRGTPARELRCTIPHVSRPAQDGRRGRCCRLPARCRTRVPATLEMPGTSCHSHARRGRPQLPAKRLQVSVEKAATDCSSIEELSVRLRCWSRGDPALKGNWCMAASEKGSRSSP